MNVPRRLNHRRRVVYAALRKALDRDQRIPKLFIFWDRTFGSLEHFVISPYTEQAAGRGLLNDQEKRDLTRALMHFMSHDYDELPNYPDEFVTFRPKPSAPVEGGIVPLPSPSVSVTDSQTGQALLASLRTTPLPETTPSYLIFREVIAAELKWLKNNGRTNEEVRRLVLQVARDMNLLSSETFLQTWAEQAFSLESLPVVTEQKVMQALIQVFYRAACDAQTTPVTQGLRSVTPLPEQALKTESPEVVR
jgi:hypothetical protein